MLTVAFGADGDGISVSRRGSHRPFPGLLGEEATALSPIEILNLTEILSEALSRVDSTFRVKIG